MLSWALVLVGLVKCVAPGPIEVLSSSFERDVRQALPNRAVGHYRQIAAHLGEPFGGYGTLDAFVSQFQVVMLSHMACGLRNVALADMSKRVEVRDLLGEVARRARDPSVSVFGKDPALVEGWGDENLYLSHLALVIGCRQLGDDRAADRDEVRLHDRLANHLRDASLADGDWHARSFPGSPKFPADQSVTLLALKLYDELRGTDLAVEPIEGWLTFMQSQEATTSEGLHRSCLDSDYPGSEVARGCALSWTCAYMAQFAPVVASELYQRYVAMRFDSVLGCGGFREWPRGYGGHLDFDTGPIVMGLGVAATGLGLAAARLHRDEGVYASILQSAGTVGVLATPADRRHYRLSPLLGDAILLHGVTARHWFEAPPPVDIEHVRPIASGAMLVLAGIGAVSLWAMIRICRHAIAWRVAHGVLGPGWLG